MRYKEDVIGAYYRVSRNDMFYQIECESMSIVNQRALIKEYIEKDKELSKYQIKEYIDDGYSGKKCYRPGLCQLLEDVEKYSIKTIIVKDFSRFSRDYLYMGEVLERLVYIKGIRFIAINDGYDSIKKKKEITTVDEAFKNIIYDYYSVENSYKIKNALDKSRENGKYIASTCLYGYRMENNKMIIYEKEANIIRYIYNSYLSGKSVKDIVCDIENKYEQTKKWSQNKIYRILREEQYTGVMIYGRRRKLCIESDKRNICNKEQWKKIYNHHMPIIDEKMYIAVRRKMKKV